jgi:5'(3')-deoxyribonucleotidase
MRTRPRFLLDVDEPLARFQHAALDIVRRLYGRTHDPSEFTSWDVFEHILQPGEREAVFAEISAPGFCSNLAMVEGATEAIARLRELGDVYFVTSPWHSVVWPSEREAWLEAKFGVPRSSVVSTRSKYLISGDLFVEDKPDHVVAWKEENPEGKALLWHIPNTARSHPDLERVRSWNEVLVHAETVAEAHAAKRQRKSERDRPPW